MYKIVIAKGILLTFALLLSSTICAQKVKLFNGQDLQGWAIQNNGQFAVEDGLLKINRGTGWLRSNQEFGDFELTMKFRFLNEGANSGIFVRTAATSKNDETGWPDNGYQIQCKDTIVGDVPLGKMIPYGAPPFTDEFHADVLAEAYNSTGKWNTYKIIAKGEKLMIYLNKKLISSAESIKNLSGHIGIQGEHGLLEFKKITVKKL